MKPTWFPGALTETEAQRDAIRSFFETEVVPASIGSSQSQALATPLCRSFWSLSHITNPNNVSIPAYRLPPGKTGMRKMVIATGDGSFTSTFMFPAVGDQILGTSGVNGAVRFTLGIGAAEFVCLRDGYWVALGIPMYDAGNGVRVVGPWELNLTGNLTLATTLQLAQAIQDTGTAVTATGSDSAGAADATNCRFIRISGGSANTGIRLRNQGSIIHQQIWNNSGSDKKVYPVSGGKLVTAQGADLGTDTALVMTDGQVLQVENITATNNWVYRFITTGPATTTHMGQVELNQTPGSSTAPEVVAIMANGTIQVTASGGNAAGATFTGNVSGAGVRGIGGSSAGPGADHETGAGGVFLGTATVGNSAYGVVGKGSRGGSGVWGEGDPSGDGSGNSNGVNGKGYGTLGRGISGEASSGYGCFGSGGAAGGWFQGTSSGVGVLVTSSSGTGVDISTSGSAYALQISGDTTSPAKAAFRMVPQDAQPSGPNSVGDMYMTTAGVLKVCTAAGSPGTWTSVGAQT